MSFVERTANWLMGKGMGLLFGSFASFVQPVIREKVNSTFDFHKRVAEASYIFVNQDEFLDHPRPLSAKIVHIGGVGISRQHVKPLPTELERRMNEAVRGVVYVSFGTMAPASAMRDETKREFLELFARFPDVLFLMKYEKKDDQFGKGVPNLLTDEYFPQQDVLAHSRTLAFISHAGISSVNEAAVFGVPLLVIPLQGDQMRNARLVERKGLGVQLGKAEMTADRLAAELRRLLETPEFRRNARQMAAILAAKPMSGDQKVVKFAEFAAKFDVHEHLDLYGRHLNTIQYHSLDVFAFFLLLSVFLSYSTYRLLKFAVVRCCSRRSKQEKVE
ncbi:UDP-glucuronosyltransferase [Aphelenchoides fujianensis]|nr:UDP-glucuronosyltransferase [Aphelenchoides fujianensis]